MGKFVSRRRGNIDYLACSEWESLVDHGFMGVSLDFAGDCASAKEVFRATFQVDDLVLPNQSHSTKVLDLRHSTENFSGDAMIVRRSSRTRLAYGIRTADCLPVLLRSTDSFALVHAGWRGLADGILEKTVEILKGDGGRIEALIGPAAGDSVYEVGHDVIEKFHRSEPSLNGTGDKVCLALEETAARYILSVAPDAVICKCGLSTILDRRFHSYRRDGSKSGRNLSFLIV